MKAMGRIVATIAMLGAIGVVACAENNALNRGAGEIEPGAMNLQPVDTDGVASRLAHVRCDRAETCDQVGAGKHYATRADCMHAMVPQTLGEISLARCKAYDGVMLDKCDMDIHELRCADPLDVIARIPTCTNDALCSD